MMTEAQGDVQEMTEAPEDAHMIIIPEDDHTIIIPGDIRSFAIFLWKKEKE